jgi:ATP-dependent helicase/nuclease subunit B
VRARQLRAGAAIRRTLDALIAAHARFDPEPVPIDHLASLVRRWIEGQTFRPRSGESGVHVVDAVSAPFGDFEVVQLAGLVDGEWPAPPRRNVFYGSSVLRDLGWPAGADRLDGARAAFRDLLRLPAARLVATSFALEGDALVGPSPFVDELGRAGLDTIESALPPRRVFEHEALGFDPVVDGSLSGTARAWAALRLRLPPASAARYRGSTSGHVPPAHAISALERYQDCPFKYFAADVLRLEEPLEDERTLSPRARGRFVHDVFRRCFEAWDRQGGGSITPDRLDDARGLFARVAEPLLATLPEPDRAFERSRLFGSAVSVGAVDVVLGLEAERPDEVRGRRLELRVEGEFSLGAPGGRRVSITGVADRIDLLEGGRIRVLDYKTGLPPNPQRALQVPVYALCAKEGLSRDATPWEVAEAAYVAFSGRRPLVPVVEAGDAGGEAVLARARARLFDAVDRIAAGEFPPRPHDPGMCIYCAFPSVCRKDYVGDR